MKKKNRVNPIEAHFEKVILAGVSVVLLGVVSMQFLTQPNAVQVGNNPSPVPPGSAFDPIEKEAEALLAKMRNPTPDLPDIPDQDVSERFNEVRQIGLASTLALSNFGTGAEIEGPEGGIPTTELAATVYALPALPVPSGLAAATSRGTLDPFMVSSNPALMAYLPDEQPYDARAVSVEGVIDGSALRESLENDPDGDGPMSPLPVLWWRGNIDLLGVEVEREELASGGWVNATVVAGMPGEPSLLAEAREQGMTAKVLSDVVRDSRDLLREIAQPAFPPTIAGPEWVRPSEQSVTVEMTDEERKIASLKKRVEQYDRSLAVLREQLDELGSGGGGARNERSGGGGRTGGGGRAGGGGGESRSGGGNTDPTQRRRESMEQSIENTERSRQRVVDQLADLGEFLDEDEDKSPSSRREEEPLPPILDAEDVPVWVHDFTAEPGKTYRYRMRVVVNNPLFGREQFLSEDQKAWAESPTMEGPWSGWGEPVEMERDRQFFVVSASEDDQLGSGPRAAVEVYEYYYGYWRKGSATIQPGDTIHASARVPDNLPIWDPEKLKELGRMPAANQRTGRGVPEGPGGGRMIDQPFDERRQRMMDEGLRGGRPDPRSGRATEDENQLPEGATAAPTSLELDIQAMLLDVVAVPGAESAFQAVLRGPEGSLVIRDASSDRSGMLYKRLSANAREGVDQGRPEPDPNEPVRPVREERRMDEGVLPGGGGG